MENMASHFVTVRSEMVYVLRYIHGQLRQEAVIEIIGITRRREQRDPFIVGSVESRGSLSLGEDPLSNPSRPFSIHNFLPCLIVAPTHAHFFPSQKHCLFFLSF